MALTFKEVKMQYFFFFFPFWGEEDAGIKHGDFFAFQAEKSCRCWKLFGTRRWDTEDDEIMVPSSHQKQDSGD